MLDVIVVGGGPAGAAAGKNCAELGLRTLLLERRKLPRDKVCSGMVIGSVAKGVLHREFGNVPETILCSPRHLSGFSFHVPGIGDETADDRIALAWRRDLDHWMIRVAQGRGMALQEGAEVLDIRRTAKGYTLQVRAVGGEKTWIESRFVIGADGARSRVRSCLFPGLKLPFVQAYQEHYKGTSGLNRGLFHSFRTPGDKSVRFGIIHKDDRFVISYGSGLGQLKALVQQVKKILVEHYDFDPQKRPVAREGCLAPVFHSHLISQSFVPAAGNALLTGDAGGFITPLILEGIGVGIESGCLAAMAVLEAMESGKAVAGLYASKIKPILSMFAALQPIVKRIETGTQKADPELPAALCKAYETVSHLYSLQQSREENHDPKMQ
jgi:flavin-dependent dehydrogenase